MTNYAFVRFEFILNKRDFFFNYGFMTTGTIDRGMFPFQFKIGFIVVELCDIPTFISMATRTIGGAFYLKLPIVYLFVAVAASGRQTRKLPVGVRCVRFVACATILFFMRSFEHKGGFFMVKTALSPT